MIKAEDRQIRVSTGKEHCRRQMNGVQGSNGFNGKRFGSELSNLGCDLHQNPRRLGAPQQTLELLTLRSFDDALLSARIKVRSVSSRVKTEVTMIVAESTLVRTCRALVSPKSQVNTAEDSRYKAAICVICEPASCDQ